MKHDFNADSTEPLRCAVCGFHEIDHTDRATCETCGNSGTCDIVVPGMLQCMDCIAKDAAVGNDIEKNLMRGELAIESKIDQTIRVSQDIFNAKLTSIHELKVAIDSDDSIPADQKH